MAKKKPRKTPMQKRRSSAELRPLSFPAMSDEEREQIEATGTKFYRYRSFVIVASEEDRAAVADVEDESFTLFSGTLPALLKRLDALADFHKNYEQAPDETFHEYLGKVAYYLDMLSQGEMFTDIMEEVGFSEFEEDEDEDDT